MKTSNSGPVRLQDAATANGNGANLLMDSYGHIILQVSGTFSANVHFEITLDNGTWYEIAATDLTSTSANTKVKTINSTGIFACELIGGATYFRARVSGYSSGSVTIVANAHGG
jgi:hypothetical protein